MNPSQAINPLRLSFLNSLPRPTLSSLSNEEIAQLKGKTFKDTLDFTIRDTKYLKAATAVGTTPFTFFTVPIGQTDYVLNDSTISYTKTKMDTNLNQNGQLARGRAFILESVQVRVTVPGNLDVSLQSSGNTTLPNATGTAATVDATHSGIVMSNLEVACLNSLYIECQTGEKVYEQGMAYEFPCEFGISGYAANFELGTVTAGSNISQNEGVANNGFGRARILRTPRLILAGANFFVNAQFFNNFTPGRGVVLQMIYKGILFRDVQ